MKKALLNCSILSMVLLVACGSSGAHYDKAEMAYSTSAVADMAAESVATAAPMYESENGFSGSTSTAQTVTDAAATSVKRKLITTVSIDAETLSYQEDIAAITTKITSLGGYIEHMSESDAGYYDSKYNRYTDLTVRVPEQKLAEFLDIVESNLNITYQSRDVEDVTLKYVDLESHVASLRTEQKTLNDMLSKAESVEDLITIQSRLSEVRYQIESYESQLRTYDDKIDYSTIYLGIREVKELTEVQELSVGQRIVTGFKTNVKSVGEGLTDFTVWFIISIPFFVVIAVIVAIIVPIIKLIRRKRSKTATEQPNKKNKSCDNESKTDEI